MDFRARNRFDMNHRLPIAARHRALACAFALLLGVHGGSRAASEPVAPAVAPAMPAALGDPTVHDPAAHEPPAHEARLRDEPPRDAFVECESAVSRSLRENRGNVVQALQFAADARTANAEGDHLDVKGSGRYRRGAGEPIEFRYSCAYDRAHGTTSGVVLHEADGHAPAALPVWQADLSRISPEACESAVASRLEAAHSRASGIVFDGGSRRLEPAPDGHTALAGTGRIVRAPGMAPGAFRYRCEFDASGRLTAANAME